MSARVVAIHVAAEKRAPMVAHDSIEVREDFGLVGDRKARAGSKGQVTLVSEEALAEAAAELGSDIPPGSTRRNVTLQGVELRPTVGRRLQLGDVVLEISGDAEPCGLMDELLGRGARQALLHDRSGVRARVLQGGRLNVGDEVKELESS